MAVQFQSDLRVTVADELSGRMTLELSPTGDLQLVSGRDKLASQLIFAIINDNVSLSNLLNNPVISDRSLRSLITVILKDFKDKQIQRTNRSDPSLTGYTVYRKKSGTTINYTQVSPVFGESTFTDTGLENGTSYDYGIRKVYHGVFNSPFVTTFTLTPSKFARNQGIYIGSEAVAWTGDRQIVFYVDANRYFQKAELLNDILSISAASDAEEPRRQVVNVVIQDLNENQVSVSALRSKV